MSTRNTPIVGGRTLDGKHTMRSAIPSRQSAKQYNLNRNHSLRVWCSCQMDQISEPGTYAGQHWQTVNERTAEQAALDPRRLGGWDHLGVADLRIPNSALDLWLRHVHEAERAARG